MDTSSTKPVVAIPQPLPSFLSLALLGIIPTRLLRWCKRHPIIRLWSPTVVRGTYGILVRDAEVARTVLTDKSLVRSPATNGVFALFTGHGVANTTGDEHAARRKMLLPDFRQAAMAEWIQVILSSINMSWKRWQRLAHQQRTINLFDELQQLSLQILAGICIGDSGRASEFKDLQNSFNFCFTVTHRRLLRPQVSAVLAKLLWGRENRRFENELKKIDGLIYDIITAARQKPSRTKSILSSLIAKGMNDGEVRDELITIILAGFETLPTTLTNILLAIGSDEQLRNRLAHENESTKAPLSLESLQRHPVLQATIFETLRREPAVYIDSRVANEETTFLGHSLPKGAEVFVSPLLAHLDETVFGKNPDRFNIDRWLKAPPEKRQEMEYHLITFAAGRHRCLGDHLTVLVMHFLVRTVIKEIWFQAIPWLPVLKKPAMTDKPAFAMGRFKHTY